MTGTDVAYVHARQGRASARSRSRTASSTTRIPPMRADWTASGACTSGSTAHPRGATRRAFGGAATTSTTRPERSRVLAAHFRTGDDSWLPSELPASVFRRLRAPLLCQRDGNDRLVRVHVGAGRMTMPAAGRCRWRDADAGTDVAGSRGVVPCMWIAMMVAMMLPSPGPDAVALPPGRWQGRETRLGRLTTLVGVGYFFRLDRVRKWQPSRWASRWR